MATLIDPLIFKALHKRKRPSRTRRPSCGLQNFKVTPSAGTPHWVGGSRTVISKNHAEAFRPESPTPYPSSGETS